jgi:hypothetical protein
MSSPWAFNMVEEPNFVISLLVLLELTWVSNSLLSDNTLTRKELLLINMIEYLFQTQRWIILTTWGNGLGNTALSSAGSKWQTNKMAWDPNWSTNLTGYLTANLYLETLSESLQFSIISTDMAGLTSKERTLYLQMPSKILGNMLAWDK